jgi:hypothetical protein
MHMTILYCLLFMVWLGMEILGVALITAGYTTAGWSILGVFTGLVLLASLVALGVSIRLAWLAGIDDAEGAAAPVAPAAPAAPAVPAAPIDRAHVLPASANAFLVNLENAGAV